jgi:hypothetical protein
LILSGDVAIVCPSTISFCITAQSTVLNNASVQARLAQRLFNTAPTSIGLNDLAILYTAQKSSRVEPIFSVSGRIVQLRQFIGLSDGIWRLRFSHFPFRNPIIFNSSTDKSLVISVPAVSKYKSPISSDSESGFLCQSSTGTEFSLSNTWNLIGTGYFVPLPPSQTFPGSSHFPHSPAISPTNRILASLFSKSSKFHDSASSVSLQFDKSLTLSGSASQLSAHFPDSALLSNSLLVSSSQFADSFLAWTPNGLFSQGFHESSLVSDSIISLSSVLARSSLFLNSLFSAMIICTLFTKRL